MGLLSIKSKSKSSRQVSEFVTATEQYDPGQAEMSTQQQLACHPMQSGQSDISYVEVLTQQQHGPLDKYRPDTSDAAGQMTS